MAIKESIIGRHLESLDSLRALELAVSRTSNCGLSEIRSCLHAAEAYFNPPLQDNVLNLTNGQEPRLEHAVGQLAEEETRLHGALQELIAKTQCQSLTAVNDEFREAVRQWMQRFRRHHDCKIDLIQDAWNQEIGTGD